MKNKIGVIILLLTFGLTMSCTREHDVLKERHDDILSYGNPTEDNSIVFKVKDIGFSVINETSSLNTKGSLTSAVTTMSSCYVSASSLALWDCAEPAWHFHNSSYNISDYTATGQEYWPDDDPGTGTGRIVFFGSNIPVTDITDEGPIYAVDTDDNTDVVMAVCDNGDYKQMNTLSFEHILSAINGFSYTCTAVNVSNVTVSFVPYTSGYYNAYTSQWERNQGSDISVELSASSNTEGAYSFSNPLLVIPGTYNFMVNWVERDGPKESLMIGYVSMVLTGGDITDIQFEFTPDGVTVADSEYLTMWITTDGTIYWNATSSGFTKTIQYCKNYETSNGDLQWTYITSSTSGTGISVQDGDVLLFKGDNSTYASASEYNFFSSDCNFWIGGNILSLVGFDEDLSDFAFRKLFYNCNMMRGGKRSGILDHLRVPVGFERLKLPSKTLGESCYESMFEGCESLYITPVLPATRLATNCYKSMYKDANIFNTIELPAVTLADGCYASMFSGCVSIDNYNVSQLPAVSLAPNCYQEMFSGCTGLITAPALPATVMVSNCYQGMFSGCTGLTTAPSLPAMTLADGCYESMFTGCTALASAPALPATALAPNCYRYLFNGCSSLSAAPELPAMSLNARCYEGMFADCTNLRYIKTGFIDAPEDAEAINALDGWVTRVASNGVFIKNPSASWNEYESSNIGSDGVPSTWVVNPLTFDILSSGSIIWKNNGAGSLRVDKSVSYSKDGGLTWNSLTSSNAGTSVSVSSGDRLLIKGSNESYAAISDPQYHSFITSGGATFNVKGDPRSLRMGYSSLSCSSGEAFWGLFHGCSGLLDAGGLIISSELEDYQYKNFFSECSNLSVAPALPATTLSSNCYDLMFSGCTSLSSAPALPAAILSVACYKGMFQNCSSLTVAPALKAKYLAASCYESMFAGCTALTTAPALPATTLQASCYKDMFSGCTALTTAPALPATTLQVSCYSNMFYGCTALEKAPYLPAVTLVSNCYNQMFSGCSSLHFVRADFTTTPSSSYTNNWLSGTKSNGILLKNNDANWHVEGDSGVPASWVWNPLQFTIIQGSGNITWKASDASVTRTIYYSLDAGKTWTACTSSTSGSSIPCSVGDVVYVRGTTTYYALDGNTLYNSFSDGSPGLYINVSGDISSLRRGYSHLNVPNNGYAGLFRGNTHLINASGLILPATTLNNYSYYGMFEGCDNLISGPSELPATSFGSYACAYMFNQCRRLIQSPYIKTSTLNGTGCFERMFYNCNSLRYIKCAVSSLSASDCLDNWVNGVLGRGVYVGPYSVSGVSGVPSGWNKLSL